MTASAAPMSRTLPIARVAAVYSVSRAASGEAAGCRGEDEEREERRTYLAARRGRFAVAIEEDLRRAGERLFLPVVLDG